jgi:hypothetical protein
VLLVSAVFECWQTRTIKVKEIHYLRRYFYYYSVFKYLRDFVFVLGISARGHSRVLFYLGQFPLDVIGVYLTCKLDK